MHRSLREKLNLSIMSELRGSRLKKSVTSSNQASWYLIRSTRLRGLMQTEKIYGSVGSIYGRGNWRRNIVPSLGYAKQTVAERANAGLPWLMLQTPKQVNRLRRIGFLVSAKSMTR